MYSIGATDEKALQGASSDPIDPVAVMENLDIALAAASWFSASTGSWFRLNNSVLGAAYFGSKFIGALCLGWSGFRSWDRLVGGWDKSNLPETDRLNLVAIVAGLAGFVSAPFAKATPLSILFLGVSEGANLVGLVQGLASAGKEEIPWWQIVLQAWGVLVFAFPHASRVKQLLRPKELTPQAPVPPPAVTRRKYVGRQELPHGRAQKDSVPNPLPDGAFDDWSIDTSSGQVVRFQMESGPIELLGTPISFEPPHRAPSPPPVASASIVQKPRHVDFKEVAWNERGEFETTLEAVLRNGQILNTEQAVRLGIDWATVLSRVHRLERRYGDLNPSRLQIVAKRGEGGVIQIRGMLELPSNLTEVIQDQGTIFSLSRGNRSYQPPEMHRHLSGLGPLTPAADLRSLCVCLFEGMTGTRLFSMTGHERRFQLDAIYRIDPTRLWKISDNLPLRESLKLMSLDDTLRRGMNYRPLGRYQTAEELLDDLRRCLKA